MRVHAGVLVWANVHKGSVILFIMENISSLI